jgi:signal transduction histidine kinase/CheY-like chemotaxis protein
VSSEDTSAQIRQLRQFIRWMFAIVASFALLYFIALVTFRTTSAAAIAGVLVAYLGLLLFARAQLRRARLRPAVLTVCAGLLVADLLIVLVQPPLYPIFAMIPLVAITVALPFVRGRWLAVLLAICWLSTASAMLIGEFVAPFSAMPEWFVRLIRVTGVASAAALALLLLWQFSSRLNATLDRMRDTLASLRQAQAAQRRSQETYTALLNATPDLMLRVTADGTCLDYKPPAGPGAAEVPSRYVGKPLEAIVPPEAAEVFRSQIGRALATGAMQVWEYQVASRAAVQDNEARVVVSGEDEVLIIVRDMTERKRAEAQRLALERKLLETQRLESIGVLAGGIAHDFNNILTAILGNAGIALLELPSGSAARDTIHQIEAATERAAMLTRQMLAYSGQGRYVVDQVDLNALIRDTASLVEASIEHNVEILFHLAPELPRLEGDPSQLRQVILNLVTNAAEAIGAAGGTIDLRTARACLDATALAAYDLAPEPATGEYIVLEVRDTGPGMDAETLTRIFDPFFTTKFTGRGLGLAAVQGIVRGHKGGLKVASRVGAGTTFTIALPASPEQRPAVALQPPRRRGAVLVIDDEPGVRLVAARVLERIGFVVLQAEDGPAGLELFRQWAEAIEWVLLDLMMPDMSGGQVFAELQRIQPGTPVVMMSGYAEDATTRRFDGGVPAGFLQKPFTLQELREVVRQVMDARSA